MMRNLSALLRIFLIVLLAITVITGCGRKHADRITDEEALAQGMVQDPVTGSWGYPQPSPYDEESPYGTNEADNDAGDDDSEDYSADDADDAGDADDTGDTDASADGEDASADDEGGDSDASVGASESDEAGYDDSASGPAGYASSDGYGGYGDPYGQQQQGDPKYFATKIVPILQSHCYNCHGGGRQGEKGGVSLHSPNAIDEAYVISARDLQGSLLYEVVTTTDADRRMPPKGPRLSKEEVDIIAKWINDGASFGDAPRDAPPAARGGGGYGDEDAYAAYGNQGNVSGYGGIGDGYGDADGQEAERPAPVRPQNLAEWASLSFQNGRDAEAMNQLYAQALVRSDDGKAVLEKYQWFPGFKRAKLALRWGVGIKYQGKSRYEGRPRPVGVVQDLPGDEFDDVDESDEEAREFRNETLDYYTGDIGDELLVRLRNRINRSDYGEVLKAELAKTLEATSDDEDEFYDDDDSGYGGNAGRFSGYGSGYGGDGGGSDDDDKPDGDKIEQLLPGVTLLGVAGTTDLFLRAHDQDIDLMVVFDVVADPNRVRRFVDTSTRVRLYDVATEKQIAITGKINNVEIQKLRSEDPDDETVINEMGKIFNIVDKMYRAKTFPDVTSDKGKSAVIGFVKSALAHPSKNPLWKLAEIRFYEHRGGLKPEHALAAMKKLVPAEAAKLQSLASDDEARTLLANWLTVKESLASGRGDGEGELGEDGAGSDEFR